MAIDHNAIIKRIDVILSQYKPDGQWDEVELAKVYSMTVSALSRFAPAGSTYANAVLGYELALSKRAGPVEFPIDSARGLLEALRSEYEHGYLESVTELIHADTFADFLDMAHHLLQQGYKDPAAIVTGSVLESHLHKLCDKHSVPITNPDGSPRKGEALNTDLRAAKAYELLDQKSITAWLDLRNKAAHGKYDEYSKDQVSLLLESVRNFIQRVPA